MSGGRETTEREVRVAARALARAGLVHAYGHVSRRIDAESFLVCAAKPMGTIQPGDPGTVVPIMGLLPDGVLGEVRVHQRIYRRRPDVGAVCRVMPPVLMALSILRITPTPRHGFGAFFAPRPPLWDDARLLRDDGRADELAQMLGAAPAIVMRANGAVTVGDTMMDAVSNAWFLEEAARVEEMVRRHDPEGAARLSEGEVTERQDRGGRVVERMWDHLTFGDPEL